MVKAPLLLWFFHLLVHSYCIEVEFLGIGDCQIPVATAIDFTYDIHDDPKSVDGTMVVKRDISGEDGFRMAIHQKKDEWNYNVNEVTGDIKTYIDKFLSKAWEIVKDKSDPPIEGDCDVEAGTYSVTGLELAGTDVTIPPSMIGQFKLDINLLNEDDESEFCTCIEILTKNESDQV